MVKRYRRRSRGEGAIIETADGPAPRKAGHALPRRPPGHALGIRTQQGRGKPQACGPSRAKSPSGKSCQRHDRRLPGPLDRLPSAPSVRPSTAREVRTATESVLAARAGRRPAGETYRRPRSAGDGRSYRPAACRRGHPFDTCARLSGARSATPSAMGCWFGMRPRWHAHRAKSGPSCDR